MAQVTSRQTLKDYCLRELGFPVITINVDDDQVDDRIDEALSMFYQFHVDATQKVYIGHQITANDMNTRSITMPNTVIGVTRIFPINGGSVNSGTGQNFNIFDINYQIRLNELYDFTSADYVYYELAQQHIQTLSMLFFGDTPIKFNRYTNTLYPDLSWGTTINAGNWVLAECYQLVDPTTGLFWGDTWLKRYTTACIKMQWGNNLKKMSGVALPGGITLNGQIIFDEAKEEKHALELELRDAWEAPPMWEVG
jgi:hypothetical protein